MQVPSILLGESRTRLLQGIAIGAVASMMIGFSWGGWMTARTADKIAAERADTAVVTALTPICVEKFLQNSDAKANLAILQKISSNWEQGQSPDGLRILDQYGHEVFFWTPRTDSS